FRSHHPPKYYTCSEHPSRSRFRSQSGPLPAYPPGSEPYWMAAKKTLLLRRVWFHSANNKNTGAEPQHLPCTGAWHNPFLGSGSRGSGRSRIRSVEADPAFEQIRELSERAIGVCICSYCWSWQS